MIANPDFAIRLFSELKQEREAKKMLAEKNEGLEIALNESLRFYTVAKYNKKHNHHWDLDTCKTIGKKLSAYCRANSIEIRKCETNDKRFGETNSYPLTAWEAFLYRERELVTV